jgi:hypothetical protein
MDTTTKICKHCSIFCLPGEVYTAYMKDFPKSQLLLKIKEGKEKEITNRVMQW